jgi:hypothetical protein
MTTEPGSGKCGPIASVRSITRYRKEEGGELERVKNETNLLPPPRADEVDVAEVPHVVPALGDERGREMDSVVLQEGSHQ